MQATSAPERSATLLRTPPTTSRGSLWPRRIAAGGAAGSLGMRASAPWVCRPKLPVNRSARSTLAAPRRGDGADRAKTEAKRVLPRPATWTGPIAPRPRRSASCRARRVDGADRADDLAKRVLPRPAAWPRPSDAGGGGVGFYPRRSARATMGVGADATASSWGTCRSKATPRPRHARPSEYRHPRRVRTGSVGVSADAADAFCAVWCWPLENGDAPRPSGIRRGPPLCHKAKITVHHMAQNARIDATHTPRGTALPGVLPASSRRTRGLARG
jgi:hypothetical protein